MPPTKPPLSGGVTVLLPAHNEALTVRTVVEDVLKYLPDVLVISDGSTDGTVAALDELTVEVIAHRKNAGKGQRLAEGMALAFSRGAQAVLTIDADGQHDPNDIPAFLAASKSSPDALVIGERCLGDIPKRRAIGIGFGDFFIGWGAGQTVRDAQCGMRLYPASVWEKFKVRLADSRDFAFETAVLLEAGISGVSFIRVPIEARYEGHQQRPSHFRPILDTLRIVGTVGHFLLRNRLRPRGLLIALGLLK